VDELEEFAPLRAWLFRIAHNRALDLLRSRAIRAAAHEVADPESPDPVEVLMRREAVETAVSRLHVGAAPLEHQSPRRVFPSLGLRRLARMLVPTYAQEAFADLRPRHAGQKVTSGRAAQHAHRRITGGFRYELVINSDTSRPHQRRHCFGR
jgi:hypothetical protein